MESFGLSRSGALSIGEVFHLTLNIFVHLLGRGVDESFQWKHAIRAKPKRSPERPAVRLGTAGAVDPDYAPISSAAVGARLSSA
jgi:hypothetical protein